MINPKSAEEKQFKFACVLDQNSTQQDVFNQTGIPLLIQKVFEGYNATVFTYGHTGAGKTYTLEGNLIDEEMDENLLETSSPQDGIIGRSVKLVYKLIK